MSQKNQNNRTKIEVVINQADYSTAATIDAILSLDKAGLIAASGVLNNFFDMYRWWRLDKVVHEVIPETSVTLPFYSALIQPDAVAPTDALDFETPNQHLNGFNVSAAENRLTLNKPALAQIGTKMPTHSDAAIETLDSYGTIYHGSIGSNLNFARYSRTTIHIEFFVLTDPDTLSMYIEQRIEALEENKQQKNPKSGYRVLSIPKKQTNK